MSQIQAITHQTVRTGRNNRRRPILSVAATLLFCLLVAGLLVGLSQIAAHAQEQTTLRCRLSAGDVAVGEEITFFIEVLDVEDLYGYELNLSFEPSRMQFQDADAGEDGVNLTIGDFLSPDFKVENEIDNDDGEVILALTQIKPSEPASGSGELARATLEGVEPGLVQFAFSDVVLSDPAGEEIPVELQNCDVDVVEAEVTETPETPTPETPTPETPTPPTGDLVLTVEPDTSLTETVTNSTGSEIELGIEPGTVTDTITLVYTEATTPTTEPAAFAYAGVSFLLEAYRNDVLIPNFEFEIPIQLRIRYTDAGVEDVIENALQLRYLQAETFQWAGDGIGIVQRVPGQNELAVTIAHLSRFATFGPPAPVGPGNDDDEIGSVSGAVFEDLNEDGVRNPTEPGVRAFVKLYLLDSERQWAALNDNDGNYVFNSLPDGDYIIEVSPLIELDYVFTTAATIDLSVSDGAGASNADFGLDLDRIRYLYLAFLRQEARGALAGESPEGTTADNVVYVPALAR